MDYLKLFSVNYHLKQIKKDIISLRESLEKYFDVLENKINTLDIRIYDEDIASLNDELGKLSKDVTNNLRSYSETTDDTFDKVQQEFGASISYIKNSLQELSNKEENDLNEVKELHSQLKKIVEDIPNQESRFDPTSIHNTHNEILSSVEALKDSLINSDQSLNEKIDGLDIRYYEKDIENVNNLIEDVKSSIKYYDDDVSLIENKLLSAQKNINSLINKKVKKLEENIRKSSTKVKNSFPTGKVLR